MYMYMYIYMYIFGSCVLAVIRPRRSFDDANKASQHRKTDKPQQQNHQQRGGTGDHAPGKPKKRDYQGQPKSNGQRNDKSAGGAQQQHQQKKYR